MPSLRDLKNRINSVKSTKKITSAMKMVAASKLKKAQAQAEASQPYAEAMANMLSRVAAGVTVSDASPKLLTGTNSDKVRLLLVITSDRGLCGGFNANLLRKVRSDVRRLEHEGHVVKLVVVGRKGREVLRKSMDDKVMTYFTGLGSSTGFSYADADRVTQYILDEFENGSFDICTLVYNEFKNALSQVPTNQQLIPFVLPEKEEEGSDDADSTRREPESVYEFEPDEETMLAELLPRNVGVQIFRALLDSAAGEQAARMTAMDNATRNAGEMIDDLTLQYNRERQAYITKELLEITSGAEALAS